MCSVVVSHCCATTISAPQKILVYNYCSYSYSYSNHSLEKKYVVVLFITMTFTGPDSSFPAQI